MITLTKQQIVASYGHISLLASRVATSLRTEVYLSTSATFTFTKTWAHTFLLTFTKSIRITFIYTGQLKIPLCSTSCYQNLSKTSLKPIWKHCSDPKSYLEHINYLYILKVILFYILLQSHILFAIGSTQCYQKRPHIVTKVFTKAHTKTTASNISICIYISIYKVVSISICISVYKSRLHLWSCLLLRQHHFILLRHKLLPCGGVYITRTK